MLRSHQLRSASEVYLGCSKRLPLSVAPSESSSERALSRSLVVRSYLLVLGGSVSFLVAPDNLGLQPIAVRVRDLTPYTFATSIKKPRKHKELRGQKVFVFFFVYGVRVRG